MARNLAWATIGVIIATLVMHFDKPKQGSNQVVGISVKGELPTGLQRLYDPQTQAVCYTDGFRLSCVR